MILVMKNFMLRTIKSLQWILEIYYNYNEARKGRGECEAPMCSIEISEPMLNVNMNARCVTKKNVVNMKLVAHNSSVKDVSN